MTEENEKDDIKTGRKKSRKMFLCMNCLDL